MMRRTYLDWNATAPLRPEARSAMVAALDVFGNASSIHTEGRAARGMIEAARVEVAALVGAEPGDVSFTSGATEANNWVIRSGWDRIVLSGLEHDSVLAAAEASCARMDWMPVASTGVVDDQLLVEHVRGGGEPAGRVLLALQFANNETGVVQPVADVVAVARQHGMPVLCDAVQAAGRIAIDFKTLGADYLTISAHKLGGPKGLGALVARRGSRLQALIAGGGQERRQRAGTENTAAIAGFGAAAAAARRELISASTRMLELRTHLERGLAASTPDAQIIGVDADRLPNTTCVALPGRQAELLVVGLDLADVAVSAGAACSSGKVGRSRVLEAMQLGEVVAEGAIRVSLGPTTTHEDIAAFLAAWNVVAAKRRRAA